MKAVNDVLEYVVGWAIEIINQHQDLCWLIVAVLLTIALLLLISKRKKIEALQREIVGLQFLDSHRKKEFICSVAEDVFDGFHKIVEYYPFMERKKQLARMMIFSVEDNLKQQMSREKIFESIDEIVNYFEYNLLGVCVGKIVDDKGEEAFWRGCEILRDLKRIPLDDYEGEFSFLEIIQNVTTKLPMFKKAVQGMIN